MRSQVMQLANLFVMLGELCSDIGWHILPPQYRHPRHR
jgi:hypothetical protein